MPEFFLELFSEEIPARMQYLAAQRLADAIWFIQYALDPGLEPTQQENLQLFSGPRRIALSVTVGAEKPGETIEERGPRDTAPEMALSGFLKKHNADRSEILTEKGYFVLRREQPSEAAFSYIERTLPQLIVQKIEWPKSMRWGQSGDFNWVRPLRRMTCLLDGEVIPIVLGPITASNVTEGHRATAAPFIVSSAGQWQRELRDLNVVASYEERSGLIKQGLAKRAADVGAAVVVDEFLLNEVTGLVEWPVVHLGKIDAKYMSLPPEVRELSMKVNQKYFALRDADGKPAPFFAFVANLEAPDGGVAIVAGNERVLRARLADAAYFWNTDLTVSLDVLLPKLETIIFHARIGTQRARTERLSALSRAIAIRLGADMSLAKQAEWAGLLCKADLVTGMVGEFPELQGIMGGYYAEWLSGGWDGAVVGPALKTHYQPKGPGDAVPVGLVPVSVALADKLDSLIQFFRIAEIPTGSGDPYALRRAALGVIRIVLENELRLPLRPLLSGDDKLFDFIIERLRVKLRGEGKRFDVLDAVLGAGTDDDLLRIMQRVEAVAAFLATADGANLLAAYRRAANILRIEDGRDGPHRADTRNTASGASGEIYLAEALAATRSGLIADVEAGRFAKSLALLSRLREPVDRFFDQVTVNDPEPELRLNRLRLLALLRDTMHLVADFSKIQG